MSTVVLLGTLDTKGAEYSYVKAGLLRRGCDVLVVDTGVLGRPAFTADIPRDEVVAAAGADLTTLTRSGDRGAAVTAMANGATEIVQRLYAEGRLDALLALGGSGGTSIATGAMRALPTGVPKVMVSTMASGNTRPYVGASDITMIYSVVDVAGLNQVSAHILDNAAAATAAMADVPVPRLNRERPMVATSMLGLTMPCVDAVRTRLDELGYEVLVFHATGVGGESLEALARDGRLAGVVDATPTELADQLAGGICSSGSKRLTAAGTAGIPQVISLGGLDMVNFGPPDTVPDSYRQRTLHAHNPNVTLMRTSSEECATLGHEIARKLSSARAPVSLFVPTEGLSLASEPGGALHDARADDALVRSLLDELARLDANVVVRRPGKRLNDPAFGRAMAEEIHRLLAETATARWNRRNRSDPRSSPT